MSRICLTDFDACVDPTADLEESPHSRILRLGASCSHDLRIRVQRPPLAGGCARNLLDRLVRRCDQYWTQGEASATRSPGSTLIDPHRPARPNMGLSTLRTRSDRRHGARVTYDQVAPSVAKSLLRTVWGSLCVAAAVVAVVTPTSVRAAPTCRVHRRRDPRTS